MDQLNKQQNSLTSEELNIIISYFLRLGYKPDKDTVKKLQELATDYPDRDFVECAKQMYEWFDETRGRTGRVIKSYHLTFRNWVKKDYAPKKPKQHTEQNFFDRPDLW